MKKTDKELLKFFELEPFDVIQVHNINYLVLPIGESIKLHNINGGGRMPLAELLNYDYKKVKSKLLGSKGCCQFECSECPLNHLSCNCYDNLFEYLYEIQDDPELYDLALRRLIVEVK